MNKEASSNKNDPNLLKRQPTNLDFQARSSVELIRKFHQVKREKLNVQSSQTQNQNHGEPQGSKQVMTTNEIQPQGSKQLTTITNPQVQLEISKKKLKTTPIYRPLSLDDSLQKNGQEEDESINLACHSEPVDATNMRKEIDQSIEIEEATDDMEKGNNVVFVA